MNHSSVILLLLACQVKDLGQTSKMEAVLTVLFSCDSNGDSALLYSHCCGEKTALCLRLVKISQIIFAGQFSYTLRAWFWQKIGFNFLEKPDRGYQVPYSTGSICFLTPSGQQLSPVAEKNASESWPLASQNNSSGIKVPSKGPLVEKLFHSQKGSFLLTGRTLHENSDPTSLVHSFAQAFM